MPAIPYTTGMPKVVPEYKEEAKKKIIAAGREVMSRKGYRATTMEEIAEYVGVSKPTLYLYFGSKDELVIEIVKAFPEQIREAAMSIDPAASPLEAWIAILDFFLDHNPEQNALFYELLSMIPRNPEIAQRFSENMILGLERSTPEIAEQQRQGLVFGGADPRTVTLAIISLFQGIRYFSLIGVDRDELRERWIEIGSTLFGYRGNVPGKETGPGQNPVSSLRARQRR
ncbi:MAG TPA: TetR/AcrR family transcriptional regulator [Methanoregula sp.]|nr:TetR/AcrR family transcriptional regulator [Methanoregula sp.]